MIFNLPAGASISDDLQITSIPSFSGQMFSSYFAPNGTLFAGDIDYNLYRSDDYGVTFRIVYQFPKPENPITMVTGYVWTIFVDSQNRLFVSIPCTNRLYCSTNYGASFTTVLNTNGTQNDGFYIAVTEDNQGNLYTATYCNSIYPNMPALLKSTNGGTSWMVIEQASAIHYHNIKFNSANGYLYASTGEWTPGYNNADRERIYRSKDLGQTWTVVVERTTQGEEYGNTIYLPMLFDGNWVYLGTDQAYQPNWIDRFYDTGANTLFKPLTVYSFPSDSNCPVISAVWLSGTMIFSSTTEFNDGTTRVVASRDGVNWEIIKEDYVTQSLHHTNMLTYNPKGIVFGSNGPDKTFAITEKTVQPTPTPSTQPTPTPPAQELFNADFETGSFSEYQGTSGAGAHSETVEKNNPHHGSYDAKFSSGYSSEGWAYKTFTNTPVAYYRQLIKIATLPVPGSYLYLGSLQNSNSQNTLDPFIYNSNGQYYWGMVSVINGAFYWDREATPSNPQTGIYYNVEICRDTTNQRSRLWIDGALKVDANRPHVGNTNTLCTGISYSESGSTVYVDCVRINTAYVDPETSPPPTPTPTTTPTSTPSPTPTPSSAPMQQAIQVSANVTVTAVNFRQSTSQLYITINKSGTNLIEAEIAKTSLPSISALRVYINNSQKTFTYIDTGTSWLLTVKTT
ncbi:MAG: WD40/YVTN/BNR-like repeat-containing protein [Candidatus Bathyarchaeia archaeon]